MKEELIKKLNEKVSDTWNQGIFTQPYGIPVDIKEPVVYMRYETGGYSGGNCWGDEAEPYFNDDKPEFEILNLVLGELKPNITYLQAQKVMKLIKTNSDTSYEYYGNSTDYKIEYIILSELEKLLETF